MPSGQRPVGPLRRHPVGPWLPRLGSWRERDGEAEGVFLPLLSGGDRCAQDPPGDGRLRPRQPAARMSFGQQMRHPAGSRPSPGRSLWGGVRGCVTRHLLPWRGARIRAATPCASAQLQHLARQDRRRVVPSGLNEPQFPVFSRRNASVTLLALKIG
jgi:hypothetical protein